MNKDFNGGVSMGTNILDFCKGQFPGQYDLGKTEPFQEAHAIQIRYGHLGTAMERQMRYDTADDGSYGQVLHDDAIDSQVIELFEICRQIRYFCICHENIHGDIYFDSCQMGHPNGLGHFFFIQIMSKFTGIKSLSSQINRIGTRIDGSAYRVQ